MPVSVRPLAKYFASTRPTRLRFSTSRGPAAFRSLGQRCSRGKVTDFRKAGRRTDRKVASLVRISTVPPRLANQDDDRPRMKEWASPFPSLQAHDHGGLLLSSRKAANAADIPMASCSGPEGKRNPIARASKVAKVPRAWRERVVEAIADDCSTAGHRLYRAVRPRTRDGLSASSSGPTIMLASTLGQDHGRLDHEAPRRHAFLREKRCSGGVSSVSTARRQDARQRLNFEPAQVKDDHVPVPTRPQNPNEQFRALQGSHLCTS